MNKPTKPSVLFVCVKNGGKSQMAAGLMRQIAGNTVDVYSAGTKPGTSVNTLSAQSLDERGIDGIERMRLVRDDIAARVADLHARLTLRS